ncbi:MAG: hypothetical protein O7A03_12775 [Alphaproteobacteria bacterium]|nr:hypothetical protein [Alphaproteobacteria bacterium]
MQRHSILLSAVAAVSAIALGLLPIGAQALCTSLFDGASEAFAIERRATASDDLVQRAASEPDFRRAIEIFTQAIACDDPDALRMAALHSGRGIMHHFLGDDEAAVADYTAAIGFDDDNDIYYERRAISKVFLGAFDGAVDDFGLAIATNSRQEIAYSGRRGFANFYAGDYAAAAADFARAFELGDHRPYIPIWHYISAARAGAGDLAILGSFDVLDPDRWPAPIFDLFLGELTADEVLARSQVADPLLSRYQETEGAFYVGQYLFLRGEAKKATQMFERALGNDDIFFAEYRGALVELERLELERLEATE